MRLAAPRRDRPRRFWLFRPIGWLVAGFGFLVRALVALAAGDTPDFSERIRAALPTIHPDR